MEQHLFDMPDPHSASITCTKCGLNFDLTVTPWEDIKADPCHPERRALERSPTGRITNNEPVWYHLPQGSTKFVRMRGGVEVDSDKTTILKGRD